DFVEDNPNFVASILSQKSMCKHQLVLQYEWRVGEGVPASTCSIHCMGLSLLSQKGASVESQMMEAVVDTDFRVTGKNAAAPFSLTIHRGDGMVLLGMDWKVGQPPLNFVGFAIQYREPGTQ